MNKNMNKIQPFQFPSTALPLELGVNEAKWGDLETGAPGEFIKIYRFVSEMI